MSQNTVQDRGRQFWKLIVEKFESSVGLIQEDFAKNHDLKFTTVRYWVYQLRREKSEKVAKLVPVRFVELEVELPRSIPRTI